MTEDSTCLKPMFTVHGYFKLYIQLGVIELVLHVKHLCVGMMVQFALRHTFICVGAIPLCTTRHTFMCRGPH